MHAKLSALPATDHIVDSMQLGNDMSSCTRFGINKRCIIPPPRSPILTKIVVKSASSSSPRRLCVAIKYFGALSSTFVPSSHLTGLNSGGCKNASTCAAPTIENRTFAGCRSALSQDTTNFHASGADLPQWAMPSL